LEAKEDIPMAAPTFGTIMVPLDGSRNAEQALPVAARLAHRTGGALHLATVHVPVATLEASAEEPVVNGELEQELRQEQETYLASTATAVAIPHGVKVTHAVIDLHGTVAKTLADHAQAKRAGLVVMTTHGHGGHTQFWLGSVADRILRRVHVPVLLLRPTEGMPHTEFRRIVVALDGSPEGERPLEPALALGSLTRDAHHTLVQVVEPPVSFITRAAMSPARMRPHWREQQENCARTYLERVATRLRSRGVSVATEMIAAYGVGEQVLGLGQRIGADLIVVGTHAARGMERLLLGSVADKVIRGSTQPVLVVPTLQEGGPVHGT
jgi:nucleotide-binding universal stress UspA family protein